MKTYATKSTCISRLLTALALIALWLSVAHAPAMPSPASHEMSRIVQRIDAKTVTILPAGESKSQSLRTARHGRSDVPARAPAPPKVRAEAEPTYRMWKTVRFASTPGMGTWASQ